MDGVEMRIRSEAMQTGKWRSEIWMRDNVMTTDLTQLFWYNFILN